MCQRFQKSLIDSDRNGSLKFWGVRIPNRYEAPTAINE